MNKKECIKVIEEAVEHLEYCNYGNEYERSSAVSSNLDERLLDTIIELKEFLTQEKDDDRKPTNY